MLSANKFPAGKTELYRQSEMFKEIRFEAAKPSPQKYFFFSSRRRHTSLTCYWSSDVCSSDLLSPSSVSTAPATRSSRYQPTQSVSRRQSHRAEKSVRATMGSMRTLTPDCSFRSTSRSRKGHPERSERFRSIAKRYRKACSL